MPDAAGKVSFSEPAMTVGTHIVTVTVSDTEGLTGMDMAVLNIDSAADEEEEEEDFLEEETSFRLSLRVAPTRAARTSTGTTRDLGAIDAAPFCACGFDEADNVKISSSVRTTSTSTASMSSMAAEIDCAAPTPSISPASGASGTARTSTITTTPKSST